MGQQAGHHPLTIRVITGNTIISTDAMVRAEILFAQFMYRAMQETPQDTNHAAKSTDEADEHTIRATAHNSL
ncbi:MAG TPA: hypothetical protein VHV83_05110 [Armatimonadota bacterium]|nr:hypothetical protein [Armatimonadota bacterium]